MRKYKNKAINSLAKKSIFIKITHYVVCFEYGYTICSMVVIEEF